MLAEYRERAAARSAAEDKMVAAEGLCDGIRKRTKLDDDRGALAGVDLADRRAGAAYRACSGVTERMCALDAELTPVGVPRGNRVMV